MAKTLCAKIILKSRDKNSSHRKKEQYFSIFLFLKRFYIITRSHRTHLPLPSSPSLLFFTGKRTKSLGPRSPSVSVLNFKNDTFYYMKKILKYNQSINQSISLCQHCSLKYLQSSTIIILTKNTIKQFHLGLPTHFFIL